MVLVWSFTGLAILLLLFDIRHAIPGMSSRVSVTTSLFLFVCILSIAGGALLRWSLTSLDANMATTTGTVIKKEVTQKETGTRPARGDTKTGKLVPTQFDLRYRYVADTGEKHTFARPVSETFFGDHGVGDKILVRYALNDTSVHDIRSGL